MDQLKYSVRREEGLWHRRVFALRDVQIGHGATYDVIRARAEALAFAIDPARAKDIDREIQESLALNRTMAHRSFVDACERAAVATARINSMRERHSRTLALLERSEEGLAQARQLLHANGPSRVPV